MDFSLALAKFGLFNSANHHNDHLGDEDRARTSRTRRAIDLQELELIQIALLEERQKSA